MPEPSPILSILLISLLSMGIALSMKNDSFPSFPPSYIISSVCNLIIALLKTEMSILSYSSKFLFITSNISLVSGRFRLSFLINLIALIIFFGQHFMVYILCDTLPQTPRKCEYGIVNLNTSHQPGSHWVSYCVVG